jgi:hypothetical protein
MLKKRSEREKERERERERETERRKLHVRLLQENSNYELNNGLV